MRERKDRVKKSVSPLAHGVHCEFYESNLAECTSMYIG